MIIFFSTQSDPSDIQVNSWAAFRLAALNEKKHELQEERNKLRRQRQAFKQEMERKKAQLEQMSDENFNVTLVCFVV